MNKESFILYTSQFNAVSALSDEDAGRLFKAVYQYHLGVDPDLPPLPNMIFLMMVPIFERDAAKWEETARKRREAGAKGGRARAGNACKPEAVPAPTSGAKQSQALLSNAKQSQAMPSGASSGEAMLSNPSVIGIVSVTGIGTGSGTGKEREKKNIYNSSGGAGGKAPLSQEDVEEARDAVQAEHRRGDYEFSLLRSEYDRARQEGSLAGRQEFLALYHSAEWPGIDEILAGLNRLLEGDYQFMDKTYAPGLAKFISQRMWKMEPRKPQPQPGQDPEKTEEDRALDEKIARMRADMKAREDAKKKARGW